MTDPETLEQRAVDIAESVGTPWVWPKILEALQLAKAQGEAKGRSAALPDWQPIDTAPKDGTLVLLGNANDAEWPLRCRRWENGHWRGHDSDDATHWMPLPAPPGRRADEEGK